MAGKIYVARVSGIADYDGGQVPLVAGVTRVREGHPLLKGRESIFEEIKVDYDVETTRQAPKAEAKPEPKADAKADAAEASGKADSPKAAPPTEADEEYTSHPKKAAPTPRRGPRKTGS